MDIAQYEAETRRLAVLIDFVNRPLYAHGGADGLDSDLLSADNLARETCLKQIKHLAGKEVQPSTRS
jgi:hypothetical protein